MNTIVRRSLLLLCIPLALAQPAFAAAGAQNGLLLWLSHPAVSTLLLVIGFVGLVLEILTPGFGVFGILALLGFGLFFVAALSVGNSSLLPVLLFVLGLVFMAIELVVPGFGLPGIAGIVMVALGVVMSYDNISIGLQAVSLAVIVTAVVVVAAVKAGMKSPLFDRIRLGLNFTDKGGYTSSSSKEKYKDACGTALTILRPAGTASLLDDTVDVVTEGEFIGKGEPIRVLRIEGHRIVVRRDDTCFQKSSSQ